MAQRIPVEINPLAKVRCVENALNCRECVSNFFSTVRPEWILADELEIDEAVVIIANSILNQFNTRILIRSNLGIIERISQTYDLIPDTAYDKELRMFW